MIRLNNVSRKYTSGSSSTTALSSISLNIKKGEFIAIVGPSGSGKTTLLNIIGGLDTPTTGEVLFNKKNLKKLNDDQLSKYRNNEIGFVFQEFHLEPHLSVYDNVLLPAYFNTKTEKEEKRAKKLIEEVRLTKKYHAKASELSGGEKQRTAIARAMINNPQIILADEPTGNLDLKTGATILNLLKTLHKNHNTTLIVATHDEKIAASADKIIKL